MQYFVDEKDLNKGMNDNRPDKKNVGVLDIFVTSIIGIKRLAVMCVENSRKFISYVVFIAFLVSLVSFAVPTMSRIYSFGGFKNLFLNEIPEFKVENEMLKADKKFEMRLKDMFIVADTDKNEFTSKDFDYTGIYLTFGSRRVKMVSYTEIEGNKSYNEIYSYPVSMLFPNGMNNEQLAAMSPVIYMVIVFVFVFQAIISAVKYLFFALLYAFFTRSTTAITKLNLTFKDAFHLCFYAETIGILLTNINSSTGHYIPSFVMSIAGIIITFVVIVSSVKPYLPDIDEFMNKFGG